MRNDLIVVFIGLVLIVCLVGTAGIISSDLHFQKVIETCKESK